MKCLSCTSRTHSLSKVRFALLSRLDPDRAARLQNQAAFDDRTFHVCSRCIQACPLGAEASA
jgi:ferredoxin